ncbi:MAG: circularly permuted type 2 ATP-grasp protein, partial [Hyphomicrobiaceae bacterium]
MADQGRDSFKDYDPSPHFCELTSRPSAGGNQLAMVRERLSSLEVSTLLDRAHEAENDLFNLGITFTVYSNKDAIDRILPFDVIPRVLTASEWRTLETGVIQRVKALNAFLWDIYHDQKILRDKIVPRELVEGNSNFRQEMMGYNPPCGTYVHINGTDIVRDRDGKFCVLEDNCRSPSGVSYVVENRHMMQRGFADLMRGVKVRPVSSYGQKLLSKLNETAPEGVDDPSVVL